MGFLDSLFGTGGSASQEQARTTAQTNYPDWYNRLQQANLLRGAEAAFETYQPYGGPRMALAGPAQQAPVPVSAVLLGLLPLLLPRL